MEVDYIRSRFNKIKVEKNRENSLKGVPSKRRGFNLIELIVVIAILAILMSIGIPKIFALIESSKLKADQATVAALNRVTPLLRMNTLIDDPFEDEGKSTQDLLGELVSDGYLSSAVQAQSKGTEFKWNFEEEKWNLVGAVYEIGLRDGITLDITGGHKGFLKGSYGGTSKDIFIPSSLGDTDIKRIWQDAFNGKKLTSVRFPEDSKIEQIHARAFQNNQLTSIEFPDSLLRIDLWSFKNNNLTKIKLPPNLHTIEQNAFEDNPLIEITIGANVTTFGAMVFGANTKNFESVYNTNKAGTYILQEGNWNFQQ